MNASARGPLSGVLLVDKPSGMTSHDVVRDVRRCFGQREVGHTGTLDPMASGLMVLTLGRATRISRFIEATTKSYEGTVTLGTATDTQDAEGQVTETASVEHIEEADVHRAVSALLGELEQAVPKYSAVKVKGERLYAKARRGEDVVVPTRSVTIHELCATAVALPGVEIRTEVSKGTYIRSLAVQIGAELGVPAHLSRLVRTAVGRQRLTEARGLDELQGTVEELLAMDFALAHLPSVVVTSTTAHAIRHGQPLRPPHFSQVRGFVKEEAVLLLADDGEVLAVAVAEYDAEQIALQPQHQRVLKYACVLA